MRSPAALLALLIALLSAAACSSQGNSTGSGTGAASTTASPAATSAGSPNTGPPNTGPPASADGTTPATGPTANAGTAGTGQAVAGGIPDPKNRMLLGAYLDLHGQSSTAAVQSRERAMGRPYDLEVTYYNWTDSFPDAGEDSMAAQGTTPLIAWYLPDTNSGSTASLGQIAAGSDDAQILKQAHAIKTFGHRVFLRLAPEMNGNWYKYSGDPTAYVAMWRHVHEVFAKAGVTNVTWVWCPNVNPTNWDSYYPGSAYVDVIGVDGFSNTTYTWQTFQQLFGGFFAHFAAFAPGKPQLVVETATNSGAGVPEAGVGSAASFITGMGSYLKQVAGPKYNVIGVCWFDTDTNNGYNWRVDQTPAALQAWLALARNPYFGGHGA
jgi:mannan endo-1,4-beta-mannosidase